MAFGMGEEVLKYPFVFGLGFVVTLVLTPVIRRLAASAGLVDVPDRRHVHARPTPRCGLSVFLGFHVTCAAIFCMPWTAFRGDLTPLWWWHYFLLSSLLMLVGLADDRWGLKARVKLAAQIGVAVLAYACDLRVGRVLGVGLPAVVDLAVTVLWFVGIINAFNLIDGMDGLAAGLAAIAATGLGGAFLFRHLPGDSLVLLGLVGACLAFLRYNFHPATIFLGDSGSMFLGFTIAAVSVGTGAKGTALATIAVPLLAVGVPVFDTVLAIWRRSVRRILGRAEAQPGGEAAGQVFSADLDHVHHRLMRSGLSTRATATWLYTFSVFLLGVGLLSMMYRSHALGIYIIAFLVASYVVVRHLAYVELWDSGRAIVSGLKRPAGRSLAIGTYVPLDILALGGALAVATYFSDSSQAVFGVRRFWFDRLPFWVGLPFLAMVMARAYQRVWTRARFGDYLLLCVALSAGVAMAAGLDNLLGNISGRDVVLHLVVFGGLAIPFMVATRIVPITVVDAMDYMRRSQARPDLTSHTLVYGAGDACMAFLGETNLAAIENRETIRVVGLLCSDRLLYGRYVYGYPVLGGIGELRALAMAHHVESVVIVEPPPAAEREELLALARELGLTVTERQTVTVRLI